MGSCCYSPKKSHFLWWYWLFLTALIGLPMTLAAWSIARKKKATEEERKELGKSAGCVFWCSWVVVILLCFGAGALIPIESMYGATLYLVLVEFLACFLLASAMNRWCRKVKSSWQRFFLVSGGMLVWCVIAPLSRMMNPLEWIACLIDEGGGFEVLRPVVSILLFAACFMGAHYWRDFHDKPCRRTAWKSLVAFVVTCILFQLAAEYGTLGHYYAYNLSRGKVPTSAQTRPYKTF